MSKIFVKTELKNITDNTNLVNETMGILEKNKIKYIDNGVMVILEIKDNEISMTRKNKDYFLYLLFNKYNITSGKNDIKNIGIVNFKVVTTFLNIQKTNIYINYQLIHNNDLVNKFEFHLNYEEVK